MKNAIFKTITKYGTPVWFASDYNYFLLNDETILDPHSSTIEDIFDINIVKNKKVSLNSRITQPVHAMIFVGCQKENKKYLRWKVENSHGIDNKFKGFLVMSDSFFDDYMMIALVHKNTLPTELRTIYEKRKDSEIKWVPFWDVLGYSAE
jgi:bleomycin hydrolase